VYTVSQLAKVSGCSVRALQHYHQIGLLEPSRLGDNHYRYYDESKILELQQILFFKELGFSLSEVRKIMKNPQFSVEKSLIRQKELIHHKIARLKEIVALIDKTLQNQKGENQMRDQDYFEPINEKKVKEYTKRAREAYGEEIVNQSIKQVKKEYNNDYAKMQQEFEGWLESVKAVMDKGPESDEVQDLMAIWYEHMNKIFPCDIHIFSSLGMMYKNNEEFAVNFRKAHEHMPEFVCDAIQVFCSNQQ